MLAVACLGLWFTRLLWACFEVKALNPYPDGRPDGRILCATRLPLEAHGLSSPACRPRLFAQRAAARPSDVSGLLACCCDAEAASTQRLVSLLGCAGYVEDAGFSLMIPAVVGEVSLEVNILWGDFEHFLLQSPMIWSRVYLWHRLLSSAWEAAFVSDKLLLRTCASTQVNDQPCRSEEELTSTNVRLDHEVCRQSPSISTTLLGAALLALFWHPRIHKNNTGPKT